MGLSQVEVNTELHSDQFNTIKSPEQFYTHFFQGEDDAINVATYHQSTSLNVLFESSPPKVRSSEIGTQFSNRRGNFFKVDNNLFYTTSSSRNLGFTPVSTCNAF